jgi:hypothetical protein
MKKIINFNEFKIGELYRVSVSTDMYAFDIIVKCIDIFFDSDTINDNTIECIVVLSNSDLYKVSSYCYLQQVHINNWNIEKYEFDEEDK